MVTSGRPVGIVNEALIDIWAFFRWFRCPAMALTLAWLIPEGMLLELWVVVAVVVVEVDWVVGVEVAGWFWG